MVSRLVVSRRQIAGIKQSIKSMLPNMNKIWRLLFIFFRSVERFGA
jgi:hypothetical protein